MNRKVLIVSEYELSSRKGAAFERVKCYSKSLPNKEFICPNIDIASSLPNEIKTHKESENLTFSITFKKKESKLYRVIIKHFDLLRAYRFCKYIKNNFKREEIVILLYSSWLPLFFISIIWLGKIHRYDIVVEKNELEIGIMKNINKPSGAESLVFNLIYPVRLFFAWVIDLLTAMSPKVISISSGIHNKYKTKTHSELIPILVDLKRFENVKKQAQRKKTRFIYLGAISSNKDGLFEIVNAMRENRLGNFTIDIVGNGNKKIIESLKEEIIKSGLENSIQLLEPIVSSEVARTLALYDYALLIRPSNMQTEYGFSTKLGEYLAAGLPVIYTNVGDNKNYLEDGIHGYKVKFPLKENISKTIEKAINTSDSEYDKMILNVTELVNNKFNCRIYSSSLNQVFS